MVSLWNHISAATRHAFSTIPGTHNDSWWDQSFGAAKRHNETYEKSFIVEVYINSSPYATKFRQLIFSAYRYYLDEDSTNKHINWLAVFNPLRLIDFLIALSHLLCDRISIIGLPGMVLLAGILRLIPTLVQNVLEPLLHPYNFIAASFHDCYAMTREHDYKHDKHLHLKIALFFTLHLAKLALTTLTILIIAGVTHFTGTGFLFALIAKISPFVGNIIAAQVIAASLCATCLGFVTKSLQSLIRPKEEFPSELDRNDFNEIFNADSPVTEEPERPVHDYKNLLDNVDLPDVIWAEEPVDKQKVAKTSGKQGYHRNLNSIVEQITTTNAADTPTKLRETQRRASRGSSARRKLSFSEEETSKQEKKRHKTGLSP